LKKSLRDTLTGTSFNSLRVHLEGPLYKVNRALPFRIC
jgi:hypothetical protein